MSALDHDPFSPAMKTPDAATSEAAPRVDPGPAGSPLQGALLRRKIARRIARRAGGDEIAPQAAAAVDRAASSSGAPLPQDLQQRFGGALGTDLSGVRVHTGDASAQAAESVSAHAYTVGQDIHFARGQYDPASRSGQHLIAHEVAHTVQQGAGGGVQTKLEVSGPGDAAEAEADAVADRLVEGRAAQVAQPAGGLHRKENEQEDADFDPLITGQLKNEGKGTDLGYSYVFLNGTVDKAYQRLCAYWNVPLFPPTGDEAQAADAGGGKDKKPAGPKKGDSGGADVKDLPAWFNAMQNKLASSTKWGKPEKATQALLEAFLRANYDKAPASVQSFFHHAGKTETNKAANDFVAGAVGGSNWCQQASTQALTNGLKAHGLRFKARTAPRDMPYTMPPIKKGDQVPVNNQGALYAFWVGDNPSAKELAANPDAKKDRHTIGGREAATAPLEPGDIISLVTFETPASGHVATIVKEQPSGGEAPSGCGKVVSRLTMVSGNAGHDAGVVMEDVLRAEPPEGAAWKQSGGTKEYGKSNPSKSGYAWVFSIQKASKLDPQNLAGLDDAALGKLGLEKGPVEEEKPMKA